MNSRRVVVTVACAVLLLGGCVPASASGGDLADDGWTVDDSTGDETTGDDTTGGDSTGDATADGSDETADGSEDASADGSVEDQTASADSDIAQASAETTLGPVEATVGANESSVSAELGATATANATVGNGTVVIDTAAANDSVDANGSVHTNGSIGANSSVGVNSSVGANVTGNATAAATGSGVDAAGTLTSDVIGNGAVTAADTELGVSAATSLAANGTNLDGSLAVDADAAVYTTATGRLLVTAGINRTAAGDRRAQRGIPATNESVGAGGANATESAAEDASGPETTAGAGGSGGDPGSDGNPDSSVPAGPAAVVGVGLVGGAVAARTGLQAAGVQSVGGLQAVGEAATTVDPRAGARAAADWARIRFPQLFLPGYSRHDDSDPLEHEVRSALHDTIERAPGVHLSALAGETAVSLSSVRHHLRILEAESLVESEVIGGKRRYFPAGTDDTALLAALSDEPTAAVLHAVAEHEPASVSDLADALDRDPSTISHHLSTLAEDDLVVRERDGRAVRTRLTPPVRVAIHGVDAGADVAGDAAAAD